MPRTPTGRLPGRPKTKDYETLVARVPSDLVHQVKRYAAVHRQSVSELIRDGLEWRIEQDTPGRSLRTVFQPDNGHTSLMPENGDTVVQEISPLVRAAIAVAVRETLDHVQGRPLHTVWPVPHAPHGESVIQQSPLDVLQQDAGELAHAAEALEAERTVSATQDVFQQYTEEAAPTALPTRHDLPPYETTRSYQGKRCPKPGHAYGNTGTSVRRKNNGRCRECDKADKRAARRKAAQAREG